VPKFDGDDDGAAARLSSPRSYTLSLNPQIIYAQSAFLRSLVSSQIHTQLEFLAVGSWWILRDGRLHKIPSTREDVFNDDSLSMRDKRGLMKFLRHVLQEEEADETTTDQSEQQSLQTALATKFNVPESLQAALLALALAPTPARATSFKDALSRIQRHVRSIGYFGPGFGSVVAKYGGNAEIAQAACRAGAVGGAVYLLGHGIDSVETFAPAESGPPDDTPEPALSITLSNQTQIRSRFVVGGPDDLPRSSLDTESCERMVSASTLRSITVVSDPLPQLFPPTSENGPVPAVAIVLLEPQASDAEERPPIYLQVHSEETGECPTHQCEFLMSFNVVSCMMIRTSNTYLHCLRRFSAVLKSIL